MYESFFGFSQKPFGLNPDPSFYFDSTQHHRAMAYVRYGLHQGEGFIIVTGEVGAGKTTLVRNLLAGLDTKRIAAANIVSTQLEADDMLRMVAAAFGVRTKDLAKSEVLLNLETVLTAHARQGKRCLLIVDEAQNLSARAVEELRMLSNFQLESHALLQSFLIGQPEFRLILQRPELDQLRQRVIAACHIGPLDLDDTRRYIEHRLRHVGWKDDPPISLDTFAAIHRATGGVPRRINLLCDRVLLAGFLSESRAFTSEMVRQVSEEISFETSAPSPHTNEPAPNLHLAEPLRPADLAPMAPSANVLPLERVRAAAAAAAPAPAPAPAAAASPAPAALTQMEEEIRSLKESLLRVERGNQATLGLFRRVLEWVRTQEGRGDSR